MNWLEIFRQITLLVFGLFGCFGIVTAVLGSDALRDDNWLAYAVGIPLALLFGWAAQIDIGAAVSRAIKRKDGQQSEKDPRA